MTTRKKTISKKKISDVLVYKQDGEEVQIIDVNHITFVSGIAFITHNKLTKRTQVPVSDVFKFETKVEVTYEVEAEAEEEISA